MTTPMAAAPSAVNPVQVSLDSPLEIDRWRAIINPIMAIPHLIFLYILTAVLGVITFIAWLSILFTGEYPPGMFDFAVGVLRYQWRVYTFYMFRRESYPAFTVVNGPNDPGDDPAKFSTQLASPPRNRMTVLFRFLLCIPVFVVLFVYGIGAYISLIIAWFTVLFTGTWPESQWNFVLRVVRYAYRAVTYYYLMTDVYPGFSVE
jgi:hypothetical protein